MIDDAKFSTNDPNSIISKFTIIDITVTDDRLHKSGCSINHSIVEDCRTIIVPTNKARLIGTSFPEFKF